MSGTLVFHHNGIGDYVMSLPALRLIAQSAPSPLHLVHGDVPGSFLYDEITASHRSAVKVAPGRYAHRIDINAISLGRRYDFFVSLATWDGPELRLLAERSGALVKVGFFSWCTLRLENQPAHDLLRMFALVSPFAPGARLSDFTRPLRFNTGRALSRLPLLRRPERLLVVHGDTRREKMWPKARYDKVLTEFLRCSPTFRATVLNFSEEDLPRAGATRRVDFVRGVALAEAMRLVAEADLFLGIDSCMLHVADLCRVPGVALFGPTRAEQFGYCVAPASLTRNLQSIGAMDALSVAEVLDALHVIRKEIES